MPHQPITPLVTIGITAYREGPLLEEAWNSVLAQTEQNWKAVIILDGGADEETTRVFRSIQDSRLKKIESPKNMGPYPCRNLAIYTAGTEIYCFLDADDYLSPNTVKTIAATYMKEKFDYFCVGVELFWENGEKRYIPPCKTNAEDLILHNRFPGMIAFRKKVWEEIGGYSSSLKRGRADFDFILSLVENNYSQAMTAETLYFYRQRQTQSVSRSYRERIGRINQIIVQNHPQIFSRTDLRRVFLNQGYLSSSFQCFQKGKISRARYFAVEGTKVGRFFDYFPLQFAHIIPSSMISSFIKIRDFVMPVLRKIKSFVHL